MPVTTPEKFQSAAIAWAARPLIGPLLALLFGIGTAHWLGYQQADLWLGLAAIFFLVAALTYFLRDRYLWLRWISVAAIFLVIFFVGGWRAITAYPLSAGDYLTKVAVQNDLIGGEVEQIRPGEHSLRTVVNVAYVRHDSMDLPASGKILVYLPPDTKAASVRVGDAIVVNGKITALRAPLNPGAFDAQAYWATQGIHHRIYLNDRVNWRHIRQDGWGLRAQAEAIRQSWFKSFQEYLRGDELAVASALILGKKDLLSTEIRSAYSGTGAMHVLAVSGLHVGIIFLIIRSLLFLLPAATMRVRWVEAVFTIFAIWLFAFVSGLSPSVQRAAIMFSIIALGRVVQRQTYIINTLAGAALLMLFYNPGQLFQIGFQLSFLALLGIVWFANPIQRLIPGSNKVAKAVKSGVAASIGAQLGTLPIGLAAFKSIPVYFMISGSAVVIFAYLAMCLGVLHGLVYMVSGFNFVTSTTGWLLGRVVELQNAFIQLFSVLPFGQFEFRDFPLASAISIAAAIICLAAWVHYRRRLVGIGALLLFLFSFTWALTQVPGAGRSATLTVYHLRDRSLIDYHSEYASVAVGDELSERDLSFNVIPNRKQLGYDTDTLELRPIDTLPHFKLGATRWAVLNKDGVGELGPYFSEVDYFLIRKGLRPDTALVAGLPGTAQIIVDGSNPAYYNRDWLEIAEATGREIWVTGVKGAFVLAIGGD